MTEAEWLARSDVETVRALPNWVGPRKCRLYCCALCRGIWGQMRDERSRRAVEVAEQFADGLASGDELAAAHLAALQVSSESRLTYRRGEAPAPPSASWMHAAEQTASPNPHPAVVVRYCVLPRMAGEDRAARRARTREWARAHHRSVVLDMLGPYHFRPVAFDPVWKTDTVLALAARMCESRDFSAMPILADALQDTGCDNDDVLTHCRGPGPHFRGCWVVDLVLGRE